MNRIDLQRHALDVKDNRLRYRGHQVFLNVASHRIASQMAVRSGLPNAGEYEFNCCSGADPLRTDVIGISSAIGPKVAIDRTVDCSNAGVSSRYRGAQTEGSLAPPNR
jgi:hypothetical protein